MVRIFKHSALYAAAAVMALAGDSAWAAKAAHGEASSGGLPQFDFTTFPSQFFWLAISFTVLYFALSKRILPKIAATIDHRKYHIENDILTANRLKDEAQAAEAKYKEALSGAQAEAGDIVGSAREELKAENLSRSSAFKEKSDAQIAGVEKEIEALKTSAMAEMDKIVTQSSKAIVEKISGLTVDESKVKSFIDSEQKQLSKAA